jgi:hypothetical protein
MFDDTRACYLFLTELVRQGRKYLNYDLEASHASLKTFGSRRVIISFQNTEAFDTALLSDLILLFRSAFPSEYIVGLC